MLFIYGALAVGGVETFFVRMAKERFKKGLYTAILLQSPPEESDKELLSEMYKYAAVYFIEDLFCGPLWFARRFPLLAPIRVPLVRKLFDRVSQIHVDHGMHALLGYRLSNACRRKTPITVGVYHYLRYAWGENVVPIYEKINRKFIFEYLPKRSLLFFSEDTRDFYTKRKNIDFHESNVFRLGVVDSKKLVGKGEINDPVRICAVGRLVEFKTYNLYMLDVVHSLVAKGVNVIFDVYGDGPLREEMESKIRLLKIERNVCLKGTVNYSKLDEVISGYDLFIGSGTAIVQAASLGVPSIVAVESVLQPTTYGFFSEVHSYEYNLKGLNIPLYDVEEMILSYMSLTDEQRFCLKKNHCKAIESFTNEACQRSMDELQFIKMPDQDFRYSACFYEFSRVFANLCAKINKRHSLNRIYKDFNG